MIVSHPEFVTRLRDSVRNGNAQLPRFEQVFLQKPNVLIIY
jgi:hypothetical protein